MNVATVKSLMGRELRQLQGYSSQEAQISFISGSGAGGGQGGGRGHPGRRGKGRGAKQLPHQPCSPSAEAMSELPLFGFTVYPVQRVSSLALPSPGLLGLNRQHLVLVDPSSQVGRAPAPVLAWAPSGHWAPPDTDPAPQELCCSIALRDLQRLHLLSPLEPEGSPGLELNYGSADNPQTIWFELPQVGGLRVP